MVDTINNQLQEVMREAQQQMCKNLSMQVYGDNALRNALYTPEKQTFWRKTKNKLRTINRRISNAYDALKGDLDYDY